MKKKGIMLIIIAILMVVLLGFEIFCCVQGQKKKVREHTEAIVSDADIYITTDDKFTTLQNDGGSYYNRQYVVDYNTLVVTGYEEHYVGFEGFEYEHKEFYSKQLTKEDFKRLSEIKTEVYLNPQEDTEKTYMYYTIGDFGGEYKIYDRTIIEEIEDILH